jgi:hypothetical protein
MAQCKNNLKQLALAMIAHEAQHRHFPSAGWGYMWAPHPARGVDETQPGGWAYSILPQLEQQGLFDLGSTVPFADDSSATLLDANKQRLSTPVAYHYCPTRRKARNYPIGVAIGFVQQPKLSAALTQGCRIDYAVNGGDTLVSTGSGPATLAAGDNGSYTFPSPALVNGVSFTRSMFNRGHILDGASNTYLVGEKYVDPLHAEKGSSLGDDQGPFVSDERDSMRWGYLLPSRDRSGYDETWGFGGPHSAGVLMAMCDGSIHVIRFTIDLAIHKRFCNRKDGQPIDVSKL